MDSRFGTELIHLDGQALLVVWGEVDAAAAAEFDEVCGALATVTDRLVLDFTAVTFMDSSGLGVLIEASRRPGFVSIQVRHASDQVRRVFEITGMADRFLEAVAPHELALDQSSSASED